MKSHSIPSLLGIAAVLIAALVVAVAFGVATDSPTAQAQTATIDYDTDDDGLIEITKKEQLAVIDVSGAGSQGDNGDFDAAFPNAAEEWVAVTPTKIISQAPARATSSWGT